MTAWTDSTLFGLVLSLLAYALGVFLNRKTKLPLLNPLLIAVTAIALVVTLLQIPLDNYRKGGQFISALLAPATAALAVSIYNQRRVLKQYFVPVLLGAWRGPGLHGQRLPALQGVRPRGCAGGDHAAQVRDHADRHGRFRDAGRHRAGDGRGRDSDRNPGRDGRALLIRLFHVTDPIAQGVAIGTCSHAIGTTKAMELGELQGAMSSIAIGVAGLITVLISLFL